jgi:hypothetical protein
MSEHPKEEIALAHDLAQRASQPPGLRPQASGLGLGPSLHVTRPVTPFDMSWGTDIESWVGPPITFCSECARLNTVTLVLSVLELVGSGNAEMHHKIPQPLLSPMQAKLNLKSILRPKPTGEVL